MKFYRFLASAAALAAVISFAGVAQAGGSSGGLVGGSSGGSALGARLASLRSRLGSGGSSGGGLSHGSSGGGISHGSSGGGIGHGSSGGGALRARLASLKSHMGGGSSGGSSGGGLHSRIASGGSSGGSSGGRVGPLRRLAAKLRALHSSRGSHGSSGGGSSHGGGSHGGGSSGGSYYAGGSSGGSSGGSVSYATPVSYSPAVSYSAPVHTISHGAEASSYESPIVQASYTPYSAPVETVIDGGYYDSGNISSAPMYDSGTSVYDSAPMYDSGTIIDGGYESGTVIESGTSIMNSSPVEMNETIIDSSSRYESQKPALGNDAGLLTVAVPNEAATVTVNGHSTSSEGTVRQFMSKGLKEGYVYTYVVKIDYEMNGKVLSDSKEVKLRPGDTKQVVFDTEQPVSAPAEPSEVESTKTEQPAADLITVVKLIVPADAVVNLAGNDTNGSGTVRTFRTKALKAGEQWKDYTVRVSTQVGGQSVSEEQTVDVAAGSTIELQFDFDAFAKR